MFPNSTKMLTALVMSFVISAAITPLAAQTPTAWNANFESFQNGPLVGQDGWQAVAGWKSPDVKIKPDSKIFTDAATASVGGVPKSDAPNATTPVTPMGDNTAAKRPIPLTTGTQDTIVLEADVFRGGSGFAVVGLSADEKFAATFGVASGVPIIRAAGMGTVYNAQKSDGTSYTLPYGKWYRLRSSWDLGADGGNGRATLEVKNLTDGEKSFTTLFFDTQQQQRSVPLGLSGPKTSLSTLYLRLDATSTGTPGLWLDNLAIAVSPKVLAVAPEEVPPLTPALENEIKQRPKSQAQVVTAKNGAVQLSVDGASQPLLVGGIKGYIGHDKMRVQVWKQAGYELVYVYYDLGMYHARQGYVSPIRYNRAFWDGANRYIREDVEKVLWRVLRVYPNAKIVLWPWLDTYPEWPAEHPNELIRNENGQKFIASTHFLRVGDELGADKRERFAWSFFSEVYRREAGEALRQFLLTVEESVPGNQVIGYVIGGGQDAQLYAWDAPNFSLQKEAALWGDYSQPAISAWRQWLSRKYKTPAAISQAWGQNIASFETAPAPKSTDLIGAEAFHDPQREKQAIDWKTFLSEGRADFNSHFARIVRETVKRPVIVGVSGGESGARYALTATGKLLRDPNIDILFHQATYGAERRLPPSVGGMNGMLASHALHKKLFLADMDQRTWLTPSIDGQSNIGVVSFSDKSVGRAQNIEQLRAMWRREFGLLWANGGGAMIHPLIYADSYEDPQIKEELKWLRDTAQTINIPSPSTQNSEVAVIYDEHSVSYLKGKLTELHGRWSDGQQAELNASGVPYRLYYADDFRDGLVPPAKLYLFVNLLNLDAKMQSSIAKIKRDGATLVWLQGTGFVQAANAQAVSETMGIRVLALSDKSTGANSVASKFPNGLGTKDFSSAALSADLQTGWKVSDAAALNMANYSNSTDVGVAWRDNGTYRSAFFGGYVLPRQTINALARAAGAWCLAPSENVVAAGDDWFTIHPLKSGPVSLTLKKPVALQAQAPETISSPKGLTHTLNLTGGTTYFFKLR